LFHLFTHVKKLHSKKSQKCKEFVAENITLKIVCLKIAGVVDRQTDRQTDVCIEQLAI
jgi:hypothetical protein